MARELGLSPKKFGSYANRDKQPWKLPLVEFIEFLYQRQFDKTEPDQIRTIEEMAAEHVAKRAERKLRKLNSENDASPSIEIDGETENAVPQAEGGDNQIQAVGDEESGQAGTITQDQTPDDSNAS
ncbi:hypothetical protein NB063_17505 [Rhodopirellula sp. ICT_H3.1]|uniref:Uncharacterized protein n=2 Tax=Aporhodopirellula aestuarii TaxID=2950107 RepID=A0ABT0U686_9BACT|nr:hypothetical protein [Aporhodopirellula aestuarii]